jgi:hypothetical protein
VASPGRIAPVGEDSYGLVAVLEQGTKYYLGTLGRRSITNQRTGFTAPAHGHLVHRVVARGRYHQECTFQVLLAQLFSNPYDTSGIRVLR